MRIWSGRIDPEREDRRRGVLGGVRCWVARLLVRAAEAISRDVAQELGHDAGRESARPAESAVENGLPIDAIEQWRARVREGAPSLLLRPEEGGVPAVVYRPAAVAVQPVSTENADDLRPLPGRADESRGVGPRATQRMRERSEERFRGAVRTHSAGAALRAELQRPQRTARLASSSNKPAARDGSGHEMRDEDAVQRGDELHELREAGAAPAVGSTEAERRVKTQRTSMYGSSRTEENAGSLRSRGNAVERRPAAEARRAESKRGARAGWVQLPGSGGTQVSWGGAAGRADGGREANTRLESKGPWQVPRVREERVDADAAGGRSGLVANADFVTRERQWPEAHGVERGWEERSAAETGDAVWVGEGRWPELPPEIAVEQQEWAYALAQRDHWRALDAEQRGGG